MKKLNINNSRPRPVSNGVNNLFSNIQKEARKIALTPDERESMRLRLEGVMQAHHLSGQGGGGPSPSPYFSFVTARAAVPALVLILLIGGGGVSYAAEGTLPGDLLYPVKITVNESVRGALAFSPQSKAKWHATAAERRMVEVETLADRGTLTPEVRSALEANFEDHAQEIEGIVDEAEAEDPVRAADIRTRFTSSLAAHASVISRLGDGSEDNETRRESKDFAERINERERKFARADRAASGTTGGATSVTLAVRMVSKESAEAPAPTLSVAVDADTAVAVRLEENASTTLREAEVEFDSVRSRLNETTISQVRDQISRVRGQIERAREKMAEGDMSRARKDGERALNDATALRTFLKAQNRSEQNILPATLSDE
ncbi:MAG: DUF5667 domain-containing protein, partial [Patescibacteria group bacterium]